jgi:hypothetical protein
VDKAIAGASGRRAFFRWLAREGAARFDELRDRPQMRLSDLPLLPAAQAAALKPGILPGVEILPEERDILARVPGRPQPVALFPAVSASLGMFNRFNGSNTLAEIAEAECAGTGQSPEAAFQAVRALFLRLAGMGVCAPVNAPPPVTAIRATLADEARRKDAI